MASHGHDTIEAGGGDDFIFGGSGDDSLSGGDGDDFLNPQGGEHDAALGGGGDDSLVLLQAEFERYDGGAGRDTLLVPASGVTLDLTQLDDDDLTSIEIIDLFSTGAANLVLSPDEVRNLLPEAQTLMVLPGPDDTVAPGEGWSEAGLRMVNGETFHYFLVDDATLLIRSADNVPNNELQLPEAGGIFELLREGGDLVVRRPAGEELHRANLALLGDFHLIGSDDDDTIVVDFSGANPIPANGLIVAGGPDAGSGDVLELIGGAASAVSYEDGVVRVDGSTIQYAEFEAVVDRIEAGNRQFVLSNGDDNVTLTDNKFPDDGLSRLNQNGSGPHVDFAPPAESLVINAADGYDTVRLESVDAAFQAAIVVNGDQGRDELNAALFGRPVTLNGQWDADTLTGGLAADFLNGGGGGDVLAGMAGDDTMFGGGGADSLAGGDGDDQLKGQNGDDSLSGNQGRDTLDGGDDHDQLQGGTEDDLLLGGDGNDTLSGQDGHNELFGQAGDDSLNGNSGDDWLISGSGGDALDGGMGDDGLAGEDGADRLNGQRGNDTLFGGPDDDSLFGGADDDLLLAGEGNDGIKGHGGADTFAGGEGDDQAVDVGAEDSENDAQQVFTTFQPTNGRIVVVANGAHEIVIAADGIDVAVTVDGVRDLSAGSVPAAAVRSVLVLGSANPESIDLSGVTPAVFTALERVEVLAADGDDTLQGGTDDDSLRGGEGDDLLLGDMGNDELSGQLGNDSLYGQSGVDRVSESGDVDYVLNESALVGLGTDLLDNIEQAQLAGGDGDNTLDARSFSGAATLLGGMGADTLIGGDQDDVLDGGAGDDVALGEAGVDAVNGQGSSNDTVAGGGNGTGFEGDDVTGEMIDEAFVFDAPWVDV